MIGIPFSIYGPNEYGELSIKTTFFKSLFPNILKSFIKILSGVTTQESL